MSGSLWEVYGRGKEEAVTRKEAVRQAAVIEPVVVERVVAKKRSLGSELCPRCREILRLRTVRSREKKKAGE